MADAFSGWVTEWHGGKTRAYVAGWVESETDKTATIYVAACANGYLISEYGVHVNCYIDGSHVGSNSGVIWAQHGSADAASCSGRFTVDKWGEGRSISISSTISGETVDGYGPIHGSAEAWTTVWVGAKVLRPPSAPTNLVAARNASANIDLRWTNNAGNARSTLVERCKKGGSWETVIDQGSVFTNFTDSPGIGSFKYRVRYWNEDGFSGYSNETDYIVTICAPAAPTLLSPASGATIDANDKTARLLWQHNPIDSSSQTQARLYWSTDNAKYKLVELTTQKEHRLPVEQNATYYWKVATRGAHEDFGPESGVSHFLVRTAPVAQLHVASPVTNLPIPVSWDYEDAMGTQASAVLNILDMNETLVFRKQLAAERSCTVTAAEFTPVHGKSYTIRLSVTSTTSLSYETQAVVYVSYTPPAKPGLAIATNARLAANTVTVFAGTAEEDVPQTTCLSLFRDDVLLAEGLYPGRSFTDAIPPLDRQVTYRAVAYAASGAVSEKSEIVVVGSGGFAFFNFDEQVAKVGMNITLKDATIGEKEYYDIAASKYQKVFYGEHSERTGTITADVFWAHDALGCGEEAMLSSVEALKEHNGLVYLRLPYSDSFYIDAEVSTSKSTDVYNIASISIDWRRIG